MCSRHHSSLALIQMEKKILRRFKQVNRHSRVETSRLIQKFEFEKNYSRIVANDRSFEKLRIIEILIIPKQSRIVEFQFNISRIR